MRGLVYKIWRETSTMTGLFAAALFAVTALLTYILPQLQDGFGDIFKQIPIARRMVSALLSTEIGDTLSAQMMQAILWVHPVILTTVFGFVIVFCTRTPAGEVDRGTIDILLGWPISRRTVYDEWTVDWTSPAPSKRSTSRVRPRSASSGFCARRSKATDAGRRP